MEVGNYKSDITFSTRDDAVIDLTTKINNAKNFVIEQNLDFDKLAKLHFAVKKRYDKNKYKTQIKDNVKLNSVLKSIKIRDIYYNTSIAIDLCQMKDEDSTDFFKDLKIDKDFVNSFIDYQIKLENHQNELKDHYMHGEYKTYFWNTVVEDDKKKGYNICK